MRTMTPDSRVARPLHIVAVVLSLVLLVAENVAAQTTGLGLSRTVAAIASTPLGAFTATGPVMATSGDDKFLFGFRLRYGSHDLPQRRSLSSYGLTGLMQIEGGALIAGTFGYQHGESEICALSDCDANRVMAGIRYANNLVTTRPFMRVPGFTENDATGTMALEFGAGWAEKGFGEGQHWTADITVPLSLAVGQQIRVVTFATPAVVMAWGTTDRRWSRGQRVMLGGGVTLQEIGQVLGMTGLDVSLGFQRVFSPFGTTLGATVTWMHVPLR